MLNIIDLFITRVLNVNLMLLWHVRYIEYTHSP